MSLRAKEHDMTEEEKMKIIKAVLVSGVTAAGLGSLARRMASNRDRKKALDLDTAKNVITVQIAKNKFMEGLPTPKEQAEYAVSKDSAPSVMSEDDISSRKRDILKGRKIDFFKRAGEKEGGEDGDEGSKREGAEDGPKDKSKDDKDGDERILFRDQTGKFVSPTDPVAIAQAEKDAESEETESSSGYGIWDTITHPIDSAERIGRSAIGRPVAYTAAAIGSFYLATAIADYINKRRREASKNRLDSERDRYVELLQESEKTAGADIRDWTGEILGASFVVPMALSAMITNKIIQNRKEAKKKNEERSDSYPDDPIIMYKTSDGRDIPMDAETALMSIMIKRALIEDAERAESEFEKRSQAGEELLGRDQNYKRTFRPEDYDKAIKDVLDYVKDDKNAKGVIHQLKKIEGGKGPSWFTPAIYSDPKFKQMLAGNEEFQNILADKFNRNKLFIRYKNKRIEDAIVGWGIQKGGWLHRVLSWMAKNLGIGDWMFKNEMMKRLNAMSGGQKPDAGEAGGGATAPGANPNTSLGPGKSPAASPGKPAAPGASTQKAPVVPPPPPASPAAPATGTAANIKATPPVAAEPFPGYGDWAEQANAGEPV